MSRAPTVLQGQAAEDRAATLRNQVRLGANKNLLFWYRELYRDQFRDLPNASAQPQYTRKATTGPKKPKVYWQPSQLRRQTYASGSRG